MEAMRSRNSPVPLHRSAPISDVMNRFDPTKTHAVSRRVAQRDEVYAAADRPSSFWILESAKTATGPSIAAISCMPPIAITTATNPRDSSQVGKNLLVWCSVVGSTGIGVARSARFVVQ
jgi:hypothetical protein